MKRNTFLFSFYSMLLMAFICFQPVFAEKCSTEKSNKKRTYVVTTTADSCKGSLRDAINRINARASQVVSTIRFDISRSLASSCNGKVSYVIQPGSATNGLPLPAINYPVKINGYNRRDKGIIELDGQYATVTTIPAVDAPTGLALTGSANYSSIKNFIFTNFPVDIYLNGVVNTTINNNSFSANTINQSSILGTSITNLNANRNSFIATETDTNGIFLTNPAGKIKVSTSSFEGFSDATSASYGNGIYVLLTNGAILDTLDISESRFNNFSDASGEAEGLGGNGVYVDFEGCGGSLINLLISRNHFDNFTGNPTNYNLGGNGVFANFNAVNSTLTNFRVSENSFNNFSNGASGTEALLNAAGATVTNYIGTRNGFNNFIWTYPTTKGVTTAGIWLNLNVDDTSATNFVVKKSTFNNFINGAPGNANAANPIYAYQNGGTITNFTVSDCTIVNNSGFEVASITAYANGSAALVSNFNVTNSTFSGISNGCAAIAPIITATGAKITNINVKGCVFKNMSAAGYGVYLINFGGSMGNTTISENVFKNLTGGTFGTNILCAGSLTDIWTIANNTFNGISGGSSGVNAQIIGPSQFNNWTVSNNTFSGIRDISFGINLPLELSAPLSLNVSGNTFCGIGATNTGYAANINLESEVLCLKLAKNKAAPKTMPAPYLLTNSGGTFNLTTGSTSENNNGGTITTEGGIVGPPGSCKLSECPLANRIEGF